MRIQSNVLAIVLNWNTADRTIRCIESLLALSPSAPDVLVVDNGSSDDSLTALRRHSPRMTILTRAVNGGFAAGMNDGLRQASNGGYRYAWLLNSDAIVESGSLDEAVRVGEATGASIVGSTQFTLQADGSRGGRYPTAAHMRGSRPEAVVCTAQEIDEHVAQHSVDYVSGAALLVRVDLIDEVGLLDESYFHYGEEVEYCLRARRAGRSVVLACKSRVRHERGGSLDTRSAQAVYYRVRNELLLHQSLSGRGTVATMARRPWLVLGIIKWSYGLIRRNESLIAPILAIRHAMIGRSGRVLLAAATTKGTRPVVLLSSHSAGMYGAERSLIRVATALREEYNLVAALPAPGPLAPALGELGVEVQFVGRSLWLARTNSVPIAFVRFWLIVLSVLRLLRLMRASRPDVVYSNSVAAPAAAIAARLRGIPHVWHVRELLVSDRGLQSLLSPRALIRVVFALSNTVVAPSATVSRQFMPHTARVRVIPNAVAKGQPASSKWSAETWDRRPDGPVLAVIGTIAPDKRTIDAIQAFQWLSAEFPSAQLIVVGDGRKRDVAHVRSVALAGRSASQITFLGYRNDVPALLSHVDLLLAPSPCEAFGLVVIEALAAGVPVVGVRSGATPELLARGGGLLVEPLNPMALAASAATVLRDRVLLRELGTAAVDTAASFDLSAESAAIRQVVAELARRP